MYGVGPPLRAGSGPKPGRRRNGGGPPGSRRSVSCSCSAWSTCERSSPATARYAATAASATATATAAAAASVRRRRRGISGPLVPEHVADAAHGVQQPRLAALLGLAPQIAHVDAERVRARAEVVAPDALGDLRAREDLARVLHEHGQQLELGARELEPPAAPAGLPGGAVQCQVGEAQHP